MAEAQTKAFVEFQRVQKSYDGEVLVVKDLNLAIPRGEFLTMLGPSGSGKTTCLMMLAGFETATHGEILLDGKPINNIPPHKRGIGMVFQNYALFPHMTVGENLSFPLEVRKFGKSEREAKVKRALDMVEMGDFISRRPAQLSGGQQQMLAIGRALMCGPRLLLLDEPSLGLAPKIVGQIFDLIALLRERDVTLGIVEQNVAMALEVADRGYVMAAGRVVATGTAEELRQTDRLSAAYLGEE